jgi:hypothetical protein
MGSDGKFTLDFQVAGNPMFPIAPAAVLAARLHLRNSPRRNEVADRRT